MLFQFGRYIAAHIISYLVYVPENILKIHDERTNRFKHNKLFFVDRNDLMDDFTMRTIVDTHIIYGDLDLIGFKRELNIINMYFRMYNKSYLKTFIIYLLNDNQYNDSCLLNKSYEELYQMYLRL